MFGGRFVMAFLCMNSMSRVKSMEVMFFELVKIVADSAKFKKSCFEEEKKYINININI